LAKKKSQPQVGIYFAAWLLERNRKLNEPPTSTIFIFSRYLCSTIEKFNLFFRNKV